MLWKISENASNCANINNLQLHIMIVRNTYRESRLQLEDVYFYPFQEPSDAIFQHFLGQKWWLIHNYIWIFSQRVQNRLFAPLNSKKFTKTEKRNCQDCLGQLHVFEFGTKYDINSIRFQKTSFLGQSRRNEEGGGKIWADPMTLFQLWVKRGGGRLGPSHYYLAPPWIQRPHYGNVCCR